MEQFFAQFGAVLEHFPMIIIVLLSPIAGGFVTMLIKSSPTTSRSDLAKQFLVGWLTGAFAGPVFGNVFKFPDYTIGFVAGGCGWWFSSDYLKKKQQEYMDNTKPPEEGK